MNPDNPFVVEGMLVPNRHHPWDAEISDNHLIWKGLDNLRPHQIQVLSSFRGTLGNEFLYYGKAVQSVHFGMPGTFLPVRANSIFPTHDVANYPKILGARDTILSQFITEETATLTFKW